MSFDLDNPQVGMECCRVSRLIRDHRSPARIIKVTPTQVLVEWWNGSGQRRTERYYRRNGHRIGDSGSMYVHYLVARAPDEFAPT